MSHIERNIHAVNTAKRNVRLVTQMYYRGSIQLIMPIKIPVDDNNSVTLALVLQRYNEKKYRANTVLALDMARSDARVLGKLNYDWLSSK